MIYDLAAGVTPPPTIESKAAGQIHPRSTTRVSEA